jgi:hypothetical protein
MAGKVILLVALIFLKIQCIGTEFIYQYSNQKNLNSSFVHHNLPFEGINSISISV